MKTGLIQVGGKLAIEPFVVSLDGPAKAFGCMLVDLILAIVVASRLGLPCFAWKKVLVFVGHVGSLA